MSTSKQRQDSVLRDLRPHKIQSILFGQAENLAALALKFGTKHIIPNSAGPDAGQWLDIDAPEQINWGFKLPLRTKGSAMVDVDFDIRPVDGHHTQTSDLMAGEMIGRAITVMHRVLGIDCRARFGRQSFGGLGHVILNIATPNGADDALALKLLTMKAPLVIGDFKVRIEVRQAAAPRDRQLKCFTAPGSIYRRYWDNDAWDPVVWNYLLPDLSLEKQIQPMPAITVAQLRKGLWAALLSLILEEHWEEGRRHDMALVASGVLATEASTLGGDGEPLVDNALAEALMRHWCVSFVDTEISDRLQCLKDTLSSRERGAPTTGYGRFGEETSPEAKLALLRLRGGSDPDAEAALLASIVYVGSSPDTPGHCYIDLGKTEAQAVCRSREEIITHFAMHPSYPPIATKRGQTPLINWVLAGQRVRQAESAKRLPGLARNSYWVRENGGYRPASDVELAVPGGSGLHLNIGAGWATECPQEPEKDAWAEWHRLWSRHLQPLTRGNKVAIDKIEKLIAFLVRNPLEKIPFGLLISAGQGVGKTVLFTVILRMILGHSLVGATNAKDLEGQFYFADLEGTKLYVIDEMNFDSIDGNVRSMLVDLMKGETIWINRKYGAKREVNNYAVPIFLTNEDNPGYLIKGQKDRALAYVFGDTRESLKLTQAQWQEHVDKIAGQTHEFVEKLRHSRALREAAMFYFMEHVEYVSRDTFENNADLSLAEVADVRDSFGKIEQAFFAMVESNCFITGSRFRLDMPFNMKIVQYGVAQHFGMHPSKFPIAQLGRKLAKLLDGKEGEGVLYHKFTPKGEKGRQNIRYLNLRYGSLIERIRENTGVILEPYYELGDNDFGTNDVPSQEDCDRAYNWIPGDNSGGEF